MILKQFSFLFNFIASDIGIKALDKARSKELGFIAMKPFGGGMINSAETAVHFLNQYPGIVSDPGFEKIEEVAEVIKYSSEMNFSNMDKKNCRRNKGRIRNKILQKV